MKDFSRGVSYYTFGVAEIGFPEDDICCHWCPLLGIEARLERPYCKKTGEILVSPKFTVGNNCPIRFYSASAEENTQETRQENTQDEGMKGDFGWGTPLPF